MRRRAIPKRREEFPVRPDPIGLRIKRLRTNRDMTLQDLAEMVGVAPSHVFHIENGDKVPSEELAVEFARALQDDEDLYRAWARARSRSDFYTALESAGVLAEYMRSEQGERTPELVTTRVDAELRPSETRARSMESAEARPEIEGTDPGWEPPVAMLAPLHHPHAAGLMRFQESGAPRPARLLVPVIAAGKDPGRESVPCFMVDMLRLDPRVLDPAEPLERPFAYSLVGPSTDRVAGFLPQGGVAILTTRVLPVVPHEIYAVRHEGRVVLSRVMWNGRQLLLLPAPGADDFIVLPAAGEARLAALLVGRVAAVRAKP